MQTLWAEKTNQNNECEKKTEDGAEAKAATIEEESQRPRQEK